MDVDSRESHRDEARATSSARHWSKADKARAAIGFGLLIAAGGYVALSYWIPRLRVCRDEVAQDSSVVQVCGPLGLVDIIPIGIAVLVALLLIPDLTEISITGIGGIKRRLDAQATKTDRLSDAVQSLHSTVLSSQSLAATQHQEIHLLYSPQALVDAPSSIEKRPDIAQTVQEVHREALQDPIGALRRIWDAIGAEIEAAVAKFPQDPPNYVGPSRTHRFLQKYGAPGLYMAHRSLEPTIRNVLAATEPGHGGDVGLLILQASAFLSAVAEARERAESEGVHPEL